MYRCQVCRRRTEDIDVAPCIDNRHEFKPEEIRTLHRFVFSADRRSVTVLCTGKPPKPATQGLGGNYGINCPRCRAKLKDLFLSRDSGSESTPTENPDKLPAED